MAELYERIDPSRDVPAGTIIFHYFTMNHRINFQNANHLLICILICITTTYMHFTNKKLKEILVIGAGAGGREIGYLAEIGYLTGPDKKCSQIITEKGF